MKALFVAFDLTSIGGIQNSTRKFMVAMKSYAVETSSVELRRGGILKKVVFVIRLFVRSIMWHPDLTISTNINYVVPCYFLSIILRRPYVLVLHGVDAINIKGMLKIRAVREATMIATPFQWTANNVIAQIPDIADKIFLLPNSVDGDTFFIAEKPQPLLAKHHFSDEPVILTIARMSILEKEKSSKGYDRVIRALPAVIREIPNIRYVLVGSGDDEPNVRRLIRGLGLQKHILMPGAVNDRELMDYYHLCDVFVLPSKGEGFPAIVLLEALACGKPVIGGNREDGEKALLYGELGIVVDPEDIGQIAQAIINVLSDHAPLKMLRGELLRKRTLEVYGIEAYRNIVKQLIDFFVLRLQS